MATNMNMNVNMDKNRNMKEQGCGREFSISNEDTIKKQSTPASYLEQPGNAIEICEF